VRVRPRSGMSTVERSTDGAVVVRVRAAPQRGEATAEAARALAAWLGIPARAVRLRHGARGRTKIYLIQGVSDDVLRRAIEAL
jgi:uncharacterized protein